MKLSIIDEILRRRLIVIARNIDEKKLIPFAEALYEGGVRLMELTYSADGSVSDKNIAKNIEMLSKYFDGKMVVGAGTVLSEKQVELTKNGGGKFVISPDVNETVIKKTLELGMVSIPGAVTPTEIQKAHRSGADFVKLFPALNLGADYVKAVRAPLSNILLLAVGGIDDKNMAEYLNAGVCGFGVGGNIANKQMLSDNDFEGITNLARRYTDALEHCK